jgi:lactate dehydrogenase-like 2-hydroxyacid dehydrogenase
MRILLVDKTFKEEPDIERELVGPDGSFEFHAGAAQVPDASWRSADAVQTFRASAFVNSMAEAGRLENCRVIVRGGVGYDGLDLAALGARDIAVFNVPDYGTTEVADHVFALLLGLRRGITTFHDALHADPVAGFKFQAAPCLERLRGRRFGRRRVVRSASTCRLRSTTPTCPTGWTWPPAIPGWPRSRRCSRRRTRSAFTRR